MANWLKALGGGARGKWLDDDWETVDDHLFWHFSTYSRKPSAKRDDRIALYGAGWGLVFAGGEVLGYPHLRPSANGSSWPYAVEHRLTHCVRFIHDGVPLGLVSVDGRDLRTAMRRRSHIRLSDAEFDAIIQALPRVAGA